MSPLSEKIRRTAAPLTFNKMRECYPTMRSKIMTAQVYPISREAESLQFASASLAPLNPSTIARAISSVGNILARGT